MLPLNCDVNKAPAKDSLKNNAKQKKETNLNLSTLIGLGERLTPNKNSVCI